MAAGPIAPAQDPYAPAPFLDFLDRSVPPAQDFYQFADGGWVRTHSIPADEGRWAVYMMMVERTEARVRGILEQAAANPHAPPGSIEQKIGDFYASGMDIGAIEAAGLAPLQRELADITAIHDALSLQSELARLQLIGVDAAFDFHAAQDFKDSSRVIAAADAGGMGLPDPSYYTSDDPHKAAIREKYLAHVERMLALAGAAPQAARDDAQAVMRMETALAKVTMSRVARRNPSALDHPLDLAALAKLTPRFSWPRYFKLLDLSGMSGMNVEDPAFFRGLDVLIGATPVRDWRTYLRWRLLDASAPYLPEKFVDEDFRFQSLFSGVTQNQPRWRRVTHLADRILGFAVGKVYVQRYFPPQARTRAEAMVRQVRATLRTDLKTLSWMSPATRRQALVKESQIVAKIGYPDKWRDYSRLRIDRGSFVLNVQRTYVFLAQRELRKIGKPFDPLEWELPPQTVDAVYDASSNQIIVPAGILQPPWFDASAPDVLNYGGAGAVIGHEITHGFDDEGRQYDGNGNLRDWWTPEDARRFEASAQCIADQYSAYTLAGVHVDGKLVTGEAIADLGGVILAYRAFETASASHPSGSTYGFTPEQAFFLSFAHIWASESRDAFARYLVTVDRHPPWPQRVNGTLVNVPAFQRAFHLPNDSPMVKPQRCQIW